MRKHARNTAYGKYGFYLPADMLDALRAEAVESERTLSYVARRYVEAGLKRIREMPSVEDVA